MQLLRGTVSVSIPFLKSFEAFLDAKDDRPAGHKFLTRWEFFIPIGKLHNSRKWGFSPRLAGAAVFSVLRASHNLLSLSLNKVTALLPT